MRFNPVRGLRPPEPEPESTPATPVAPAKPLSSLVSPARPTKSVAAPASEHITVAPTIKETIHTKRQCPIWIVQLAERVSSRLFRQLCRDAKAFDGHYSSFGPVEIHGFIFFAPEPAQNFVAAIAPNATTRNPQPAAAPVVRIPTPQSAIGNRQSAIGTPVVRIPINASLAKLSPEELQVAIRERWLHLTQIGERTRERFQQYYRTQLLAAGKSPVAATEDAAGNCLTCGEAGRCPGWHYEGEFPPQPSPLNSQPATVPVPPAPDVSFTPMVQHDQLVSVPGELTAAPDWHRALSIV